MSTLLLDAREMRLLEGLRLAPRRTFSGRVRGERLTRRTGISIDFADYREYSEGDDLRHLDWNVLARLDSPVMKSYRDEEDLAVHILVDASASMDFGDPTKLDAARRVAASIGLIALMGGDAVYARVLGRRHPDPAPYRGRASYPRMSAWLAGLQPETPVQTAVQSLRAFANANVRTGVAVVISDGMDPEFAQGIKALGGRGHEVWFLNTLSALELDPDLDGDLRLIDPDGGEPVEITANSPTLKEYRRRLDEHLAGLRDAVTRVGGRYGQVTSENKIEALLRDTLRRDGWVA